MTNKNVKKKKEEIWEVRRGCLSLSSAFYKRWTQGSGASVSEIMGCVGMNAVEVIRAQGS
jgi:hypothetical protein